MSRRHKKKKHGDTVEMNLAAMLDMAFQLLAFFIFTFRPAPVEGQIALKLPPPQAIKGDTGAPKPGEPPLTEDAITEALDSLVISVIGDNSGNIAALALGEDDLGRSVGALDGRLQNIFRDETLKFDQVIIQVGSTLRYEELMRVIDICTHQKLPGGEKLSKLSFVELPTGGP